MIYAVYQVATNSEEPFPNKILLDNNVELLELWNLDEDNVNKLGVFSDNVSGIDLSAYNFRIVDLEEALQIVSLINNTAKIVDDKVVADYQSSEIPQEV